MSNRLWTWLHAITYCVLAMIVGAFVGAMAGVGLAGLMLKPQEAVVLVSGVMLGAPCGALVGLVLAVVALLRRHRAR